MVHLKKDHTDASIYQPFFMEIRDRYGDYIFVYIDGSRDGNYEVCASFSMKHHNFRDRGVAPW